MKSRYNTKITSSKKIRQLVQVLAGVLLATFITIGWNDQRVSAQAGSFVVNDPGDSGDGVCDSTCTLRDAILEANASPDTSTITFDPAIFPSPGPQTINLASALPDLSTNMTIEGPGPGVLTVRRSSADHFRIFTIGEGATVTISGITIANGSAFPNVGLLGYGGGVLNLGTLTLDNSVVSNNAAHLCGGGICNRGTATVTNSRVIDNYSDHSGGGIGNYQGTLTIHRSTVSSNDSLFYGGGVSNRWSTTACNVSDSTVSGNHTGDSGGGIFSEGRLTVTSSTVSGNTSDGHGGGIADEGILNVRSTTVANNRADVDGNSSGLGGGIFFQYDYPILRNTIVAANYRGAALTDDDLRIGAWGELDTSTAFNLIGAGGSAGLVNGVNSNQVGVSNPGLGPLQNNGGSTETHALLAGSPAIDKGSSFGFTIDQRSFLRPVDIASIANAGDGADIGAYEFDSIEVWSVATPPGTDVTVSPGPVTVNFSNVTLGGYTSVWEILPASAGPPPSGYSVGAAMPAYEISTSTSYVPPIHVCIYVPGVTTEEAFNKLRILHGEGYNLVDRTILAPDTPAPNFATKTLCALVDSLSPFVVAQLDSTSDTTAPTATIASPSDGATYTKGQSVTASYLCADEAGGSGVASCVGTVADGEAINTATVGSHTFTVTALDNAGNSFAVTHTYNVVYEFAGFFQPVENMPTLNVMNAGGSVPLKFSLGGNQGLSVFAPGYPVSSPIACDASEPGVVIENTVTAGNSSLSYDAVTAQYSYVWKTGKSWKGTCRMLVVRLNDNTEHLAKFRFR